RGPSARTARSTWADGSAARPRAGDALHERARVAVVPRVRAAQSRGGLLAAPGHDAPRNHDDRQRVVARARRDLADRPVAELVRPELVREHDDGVRTREARVEAEIVGQ